MAPGAPGANHPARRLDQALPVNAATLRQELRPGVELVEQGTLLELLDTLTGLSICIEGGEDEAQLRTALSELGLLDEGFPPKEVRERQRAFRVRQLLEFACEQVPYYRERKEHYHPIRTLADLGRLPLMGKTELRQGMPHQLVASDVDVAGRLAEGSLILTATSGTTDERVQVLSDLELDCLPPCYEALWDLEPSESKPRTAVFTSPTCMGTECHLGRAPYEKRLQGEHTLFLNSTEDLFSLERERVEDVAAELERFRPDFLMANPVYLHWLGRRARQLDIPLPPVKRVISTYQYLSALQRRGIRELFGAPVYDFYAATDLGGCRLAVECHLGRLHVREDQSLLEIVDTDGRPLPGGLGDIAATALENRVAPLVRYLTGDLGRLTQEECTCEASGWACLELHGRKKDVLWSRERPVTTRQVDEALADVRGLEFYKCTQVAASELLVQAIPALGMTVDAGETAERLQALGFDEVRIKPVRRLEPEPSLKFRLTESRLPAARGFA